MKTKNEKFKNEVRNYIRMQLKSINEDDFLADVSKRVRVEILKWNPKWYEMLVIVYDAEKGRQLYNNDFCKYIWVSQFNYKYKVWEALNNLICAMHMEARHASK